MHRLILMRHASAEREPAPGRDRDRPLSAAGRLDAARMGRVLANRGLRPDLRPGLFGHAHKGDLEPPA